MSWVPDWVVNAGACFSELIDDGLDLVKDATNAADNALREASDYMSKNTWAVVHYPTNAVLTVVRKPFEITNDVATVTDDYFYEDEKREIQYVESEFKKKEEEKVHNENNAIDQLHNEAEEYAKQEMMRLSGIDVNTTQADNLNSVTNTLKMAGEPWYSGFAYALDAGLNSASMHQNDYTK